MQKHPTIITKDIIIFMKRLLPALVILILSLSYFAGLAAVPFHPDEATQIFMSSDFEIFFQHPASLFWRQAGWGDLHQRYRELDAPLTRTLIGAALWASGTPGLPVDWDWSRTWEENQAAGALPSARTLIVSRLAVAFLFPFSLWLLYQCGQLIAAGPGGWLALLLGGLNAYLLLHTRRAMAEGALFFTIVLSIWCFLKLRKFPWLAGVAVALAFNAKQSAAPLLLIGLLAMCFPLSARPWRVRLWDVLRYGLILLAVTFLLNPFLWRHPLQAGLDAVRARTDLLNRQVTELGAQTPNLVVNSPLDRLAALSAQLLFTPLAIADVGNYTQATQAASAAYLANPLNTLLRGLAGGMGLLLLILFGSLMAMRNFIQRKSRQAGILLLGSLLQTLFLILFFPIPWQRYYLPLLPWLLLLAACAPLLWLQRKTSRMPSGHP